MLKNITLEMSLKPFKKTDGEYVEKVCRMVFDDWKRLIDKSEGVSIMLWTADGSELLDYKGELDEEFEWGKWGGDANRHTTPHPDARGLYRGRRLYMDNPPVMTYRILKTIVSELKRIGKEILPEKTIRVGTTFDPGPEFAISGFKYKRHNEICRGNGDFFHMICAHDVLNGDDYKYAAYPNGIPDKTPFGTFFGKQAEIFMTDIGFDYIWLSNGIGFGSDTWSPIGEIFDGKDFHIENFEKVKKHVYEFWELFTKECHFPVETRGTNMTMGIDLSTDGVPLRDIYDKFDILPPPNSPWAAINFDLGIELSGYMSRIAHVPSDKYMFRYYLHDPWWQNSPWYDRYNSYPHDIYLPLACARIDEKGQVKTPTHMSILSIDNTRGNMPEACVVEPMPHFLKALKETPDAPSPVVWVYPFDEYSDASSEEDVRRIFSEEFFIRGAINSAFPITSVISTRNFVECDKDIFASSVLVTPVPKKGYAFERAIMDYTKNGGRVIFYGTTKGASQEFLDYFGIKHKEGIFGTLDYTVNGLEQKKIFHDPRVGAGEIIEIAENGVFATAGDKSVAVNIGNACWVRGCLSTKRLASSELKPETLNLAFGEDIMRTAFSKLGYMIEVDPELQRPVFTIHRHNHAYIFTEYSRCAVGKTLIKFPYGVPALDGCDVKITNGIGEYHFPRFLRKECRVFVEQDNGIITVEEDPPVSFDYRRRIRVKGLRNATVRILAENYCKNDFDVRISEWYDNFIGAKPEGEFKTVGNDTFFEARNVTGHLIVSMPEKS